MLACLMEIVVVELWVKRVGSHVTRFGGVMSGLMGGMWNGKEI